jgi:hypothetical protein
LHEINIMTMYLFAIFHRAAVPAAATPGTGISGAILAKKSKHPVPPIPAAIGSATSLPRQLLRQRWRANFAARAREDD